MSILIVIILAFITWLPFRHVFRYLEQLTIQQKRKQQPPPMPYIPKHETTDITAARLRHYAEHGVS